MKNIIILVSLALLSATAYPQGVINLKKDKARKELTKYLIEHKYTAPIIETDSTLSIMVRDSFEVPFDYVIYFDQNGRCNREFGRLSTDSTYKEWLRSVFECTCKSKWEKIDDDTYVSVFRKNMYLQVKTTQSPYTVNVTRHKWTKSDYQRLIKVKL